MNTRLSALFEETDDRLFAARCALEKLRALVASGQKMPSVYIGEVQARLSDAATCIKLAKHEQERTAASVRAPKGLVH